LVRTRVVADSAAHTATVDPNELWLANKSEGKLLRIGRPSVEKNLQIYHNHVSKSDKRIA